MHQEAVKRAGSAPHAVIDVIRVAAEIASTHAALTEAARVALAVGEDTWSLFEANADLAKLTKDADITRPETPRIDAAVFPLGDPLAVLLRAHFTASQPHWVDPNLARAVRGGAEEP